ncbi:MAG: hypothetical protein N7Q72_05270, partial [Spiroplasma sp. Tabriz.8]|nr:hypothetical protein [Candidatus Regiella insecticola]MCZ8632655.1 hypothetical protein [Spiroplasma sp. Tabriz.8]
YERITKINQAVISSLFIMLRLLLFFLIYLFLVPIIIIIIIIIIINFTIKKKISRPPFLTIFSFSLLRLDGLS